MGFMNVKSHQCSELKDFRAIASTDSRNSWGSKYLDKLLSRRSWKPYFTVGMSHGRWEEFANQLFRLSEITFKIIRSNIVRLQVKFYKVKYTSRRKWKMDIFICYLCLGPRGNTFRKYLHTSLKTDFCYLMLSRGSHKWQLPLAVRTKQLEGSCLRWQLQKLEC